MKKLKFDIQGMTCSACSARVQTAAEKTNGVKSAEVNLLTNTMVVDFDETKVQPDAIINSVNKAGYKASLHLKKAEASNEKTTNAEMDNERKEKKRLIWSVVFLIPLMFTAMGHMVGINLFSENIFAPGLLQFLLLIPIIALNISYFKNGFKSLIKLNPNMDSLIAIGAGTSVIYSLYSLFKLGNTAYLSIVNSTGFDAHSFMPDYYFEAAGMILTFITIGKYLEARSKSKTSGAIRMLMELAPQKAIVENNGVESEIDADKIKIGDTVIIKNGMTVPVDGKIILGECALDESAVTGESVPADKTSGDSVISGSIVKSGYIKITAERVGSETTLSQIIELVENATAGKPPIARIADKVAKYFVPSVILIAVITTAVWLLSGASVASALNFGIAVLVISCPCALGLATPTAVMAGTGRAAQMGVLIKSAASLETLNGVKTVVLDKTGTITRGKPSVTDIITFDGCDEDKLLTYAYSIERLSEHPLSEAIVNYAESKKAACYEAENFKSVSGKGISGEINGEIVLAGNIRFLESNGIKCDKAVKTAEDLSLNGKTPLIFAKGGTVLGVIGVSDEIKDSSIEAIACIKGMGIDTVMLTGDTKNTALSIQKQVGIKTAYAEVLPADKERIVSEFKKKGKVAMVGDGINDAPALVSADVGIAIGAGTDIAIESADVVLMRSDLKDVARALQLGKATMRNIIENLFWALIYNVIFIPTAAGVFFNLLGWRLDPMYGTIAMSLSSICVVSNALRLKAFKPALGKYPKIVPAEYKTITLKKEEKPMKTAIIEGMMCAHCKATVEKAFNSIDGITAVVDLENKSAAITGNITDDEIKRIVTDAGYELLEIK